MGIKKLEGYGVQVFSLAVVGKVDRRKRGYDLAGDPYIKAERRPKPGCRGAIRAMSRASAKNLEMVAACTVTQLRSMVTLTYHGQLEEWESSGDRNRRVVCRTKDDLNRFLTMVRTLIGNYLWVMEFQRRGVVHYHLLCEAEVSEAEISTAWCRATEAEGDEAARAHAVKVKPVEDGLKGRWYLGGYIRKQRQKLLPAGIDGAGRWWGCSRGLELELPEEIVSGVKESPDADRQGIAVQRAVRKFISKRMGWKWYGGGIVNWRGELSAAVRRIVSRLRESLPLVEPNSLIGKEVGE